MYTITEYDGYKLFLPPAGHAERFSAQFLQNVQSNQRFASEYSGLPLKKRITGSFIYAHPPNYAGMRTLDYGVPEWHRELKRLKGFGIDTIIFQAALWNELKECYYPSRTFKEYRTWNVIEPMLEAASALELRVFLGGYGSVTCWMDKLNKQVVDSEKKRQLQCFKELLRYRKHFHGFYFSPESTYNGSRDKRRETFLHQLYGELFSEIKNQEADLQIMMSPATFHYPGKMDEMADAWNALLSGVALDILAPQDSIGCSCITLEHQREAFESWSKVARNQKLKLWTNVELFDLKEPLGSVHARCTAAPERVLAQISNAAPYVEKMITWEALFYTSPAAGAAGETLCRNIFNGQVNNLQR